MRTTPITAACLILLAGAFAQEGKQTASAMSSGKAVLEAYVSAWNRHDFAALDKLLATDAIHEDVAQGVHAQGLAEIEKFMREEIEGEPDLDWRLTKIVDAGSVVAAEWTWTGTYTGEGPTGQVKGQRISGRGASIVLTENGKIKRFTDYYDFASFFPKAPTASTTFSGADAKRDPVSDTQAIMELERQWAKAEEAYDPKGLNNILAEDFVSMDEKGKTRNKTQEIASDREWKPPGPEVVDEMSVHLDGDIAICLGRFTWTDRNSGGVKLQGRFVDTFLRRDGRWQVVANSYVRTYGQTQ